MGLPANHKAERTPQGGFTLLEIMVSLAILAMALVVLIRITTKNVQATNRAKLLTVATFLVRGKIVEIEDRILALGFVDVDEEDAGDFSNEQYPSITWTSLVERVELPTNLGQMAQQSASDATQSAQDINAQNPLQFMAGMMGGFMSTLMDPIRIGLQEAVRRVTVKVFWHEIGRGERSFEVVTFMTDPSRLDLAMGGLSGGAAPSDTSDEGSSGATGAPGSGTQPGQQNRPSSAAPPGVGGTR